MKTKNRWLDTIEVVDPSGGLGKFWPTPNSWEKSLEKIEEKVEEDITFEWNSGIEYKLMSIDWVYYYDKTLCI